MPPANLHLTLWFLGRVEAAQLDAVRELAAATTAAAFDLVLDRFGQFARKHDRMLWLGPSAPPAELLALHATLCRHGAPLGLRTPPDAFRPHVTLRRKAAAAARPLPRLEPGIAWPVRHFSLLESHPLPHGVRYETLAKTALTP